MTGLVANYPFAYSPGWYAVRTVNGWVGLVLHRAGRPDIQLGSRYGAVSQAIPIPTPGSAPQGLPGLLSFSTQLNEALQSLTGVTDQQATSLIDQLDAGAGRQQGHSLGGPIGFLLGLVGARPFTPGKQTTQLLVPRAGKPQASSGKSSVFTTPGGDASNAGVSTPSVGSLFGFLGSVSWWKGIGLVLAGILVLALGALELRKL